MARYTGPVCRICRREGEKLMLKGERCLTSKCAFERRGAKSLPFKRGRRRVSEYGLQLREKQKTKRIYGVLERQFQRYFAEAKRRSGLTGENLLQVLETRLDNVVYRLGFGDSHNQTRQLVRHGHITLNGRKTDIPSCLVKPGDVIAWKKESEPTELYQKAREGVKEKFIPSWLSLDQQALAGRVLSLPARSDIDYRINEKAIVEYYSR